MKVKSRLSLFDKIILWINIAVCAAILVSYLAPVTDPKKAWAIAFFGLAYPVFLTTNVILIIYWLLRKKWHFLFSLICILIGWHVLLNNVQFHFTRSYAAAAGQTVVRMMTYNVHNFKRYGSGNDVSTKREILQLIKDQQPDVISFQEFYTRKTGEYDLRDSILKILGTQYYYFEPARANSQEAIGLAIFSKFQIIAHGFVPLANKFTENSCLYIDVKAGEKQFRVYNLHLQSIRFDPEDYKYLNRVSQEGKVEKSSVKRLGSKLKTAFLKRSDQVVKIKAHAAQCTSPYIISGDFNDTPASYAVNQMTAGLKNAFRESGSGFGRTYNGDFPNYQIDYIMASPQFDIPLYKIIEKKLSDHYPVRSDLVLK